MQGLFAPDSFWYLNASWEHCDCYRSDEIGSIG